MRSVIMLNVIMLNVVVLSVVMLNVVLLGVVAPVSYPTIGMTHPSRNFFVLFLFCIFMHVCAAKSAGI
jgi:hypothetical protein